MAFLVHVPAAVILWQWTVPLAGSLVAALWDLRTRRIPNVLTGGLFVSGLLAAGYLRGGPGLFDAVAGALVMALPFVILFLFGGGAGDAKLMAAAGVWLGAQDGLVAMLAVVATGAVLGLGYALVKNRAALVLANTRDVAWHAWAIVMTGAWGESRIADAPPAGPGERRQLLAAPYGVSIFTGLCVAAIVRLVWLV